MKDHWLTSLLFSEIFDRQISNQFFLKMTEISVKRQYIV